MNFVPKIPLEDMIIEADESQEETGTKRSISCQTESIGENLELSTPRSEIRTFKQKFDYEFSEGVPFPTKVVCSPVRQTQEVNVDQTKPINISQKPEQVVITKYSTTPLNTLVFHSRASLGQEDLVIIESGAVPNQELILSSYSRYSNQEELITPVSCGLLFLGSCCQRSFSFESDPLES